MRITFVLSSLWLSGGVRAIIETANGLAKRGHLICLVIPGGTLDPKVASEINPGITIKQSSIRISRNMNFIKLFALSYSLAQAVPTSDIVLSTHTPTTFTVLLASHVFKRGEPFWYFLDYPEMFINRPVEGWLLRHALFWHRGALTISEFCRETLLNTGIKRPISVVSIGLSNPDIFKPSNNRDEKIDTQGKKPILFIGDDRPRKGYYDFLEAAEIVSQQDPETIFWIVSKTTLKPPNSFPYQLFIRPDDNDLAELYRNCAVFVSASWVEGFGLPPLEAMACGAPVVMTDSKGVRDYACPGENCLLVPPRDPKALAGNILKLINSPNLASHIRSNGPPTANLFSWDISLDRFEQSLKKINFHNEKLS